MLFGKGKGIWCTHVGIFFSLIIGLHHSINSVDAAESLRFEDGNSIQLIDAHGELLEWPRWEGPIELFSSYWTDRTLFGLQVNWDLSVHGEIRSPEPFGHFSFWPALKPSQGSSWIKASGHLAMAADGRLYEIHSTGKAFGREYDHPTTPKPIDFPPEVAGWADFAGSSRLRLAISTQGELWAWETHTTNHPGYLSITRTNWGVIEGTFGGNATAAYAKGDLELFKISTPPDESGFLRVRFPVPFVSYPMTVPGGSHPGPPPPHISDFVALTVDGRLYQYGRNLTYFGDDPNWGWDYLKLSTNAPVELEIPNGVSRWTDFEPAANRLFATGDNGELYALGENQNGQLGIGSITSPDSVVVVPKPPGLSEWKKLRALRSTTFALSADGVLYGWGELGAYRTAFSGEPDAVSARSNLSYIMTRPTPMQVGSGIDRVIDFAAFHASLVVLLESGNIISFFDISRGFIELPNHVSTSQRRLPPGAVNPLANRPPFARLLSPRWLSRGSGASELLIIAQSTDVDGSVARTELVVDGAVIGEMSEEEGLQVLEWTRVPRGRYEMTARATDNEGATTDSVPVVLYIEGNGPTLSALSPTESGGMNFTVSGFEWAPGHVEWSNDLNHWHSLQNIMFEESPITIIDENPSSGTRFYRIRIEE